MSEYFCEDKDSHIEGDGKLCAYCLGSEVESLRTALAESEEGRKHWEDLWKKASISVIGLQAKLAESERKRGDDKMMLNLAECVLRQASNWETPGKGFARGISAESKKYWELKAKSTVKGDE